MSTPKHVYTPPSAQDSRSPCPALNALANHSILPHDGRGITAYQLMSAIREYYRISLPLAFLLSVVGTFLCGRHFKIDLEDLALHNYIEHDGSLTRANALPDGRYAPVAVDKDLLQHLLDVSKNSDFLDFDDLVKARAARDATLERPLSRFHGAVTRGEIALAIQTLGNSEGRIPKQFIQEWFGEDRLPDGWFKPKTVTGLVSTTKIANRVGDLVKTGSLSKKVD
ncbi:Cloroperoxidase [Multifurca ochricompacta]|uniref:Cloroperoxidase n=1 Tax=Multifurca ochricompacta TaxID=376703 RepID=A0AAD4MDM2_9AGAM|nr:Cloroperoxidase [Multifurca ochricompacta]